MVDRDVGGVKIRIGGDNSSLRGAVEDSKAALGGLNQSVQSTQAVFRTLGAVVGTVLGAMSIQKVGQFADSWSEMRARVANAKGEMESTDAIMRRLNQVATRTYSSLNQTAESWLRNSTALTELGYSTSEQLDLTETLNNALVVSATRGDRAARAMDAWSKAMATGKLQGDNFNTIVETSDRLTKALADSLGVSTVELRKMATDGKITTEVMFGVTTQLEQLRAEADAMPATLADAGIAWEKAFQVVIGTIDQTLGASQGLAAASVDLARAFEAQADNLATLFLAVQQVAGQVSGAISSAFDAINADAWAMEAAMIAAGAGASLLAVQMGGALVNGIVAATGAMKALTLAMLANPFGLIVAGVGAAVAAAFVFRDEIKQVIGVDVVEVFRSGANTIIGAMVGTVKATQAAFENLPAFMEGIGAQAWNSFLSGFEGSAITWTNPFTGESFDLLNIDLSSFKKEVSGASEAAMGAVSGAFSDAMGVDYVGALADGMDRVWSSAAGARAEIEALQNELGGEDGEGGGGRGGGGGGSGGSKAEKQAEQLAKQLEQLRQSFMTEEELEALHYQKRLEELAMFYEKRMIAEAEYLSLIEQARVQHEEKLASIRREAMEAEVQRYSQMGGYIKGTLESISQLMGSEGDKQIGIQKAISLAIAGINVAEGITKALTLPFPLNLLAAAQTAAQGLAAIASINSAGKGNPGNVARGGGGGGSSATAAPPQMPQTMVIRGFDPGLLYSGEQVKSLADSLIQFQKDGGKVVWSDQ